MDTVIFDIGQVIIEWRPERAFEAVLPAAEVPKLMARIGFADWNRANDALAETRTSEDELVARFPSDEAAIRGYREHFTKTIARAVPGTAAVIAELQQAGVRIGALTNWAADSFAIARSRYGILDRFADIVVSGEEGVVKPDRRIFEIACRRLGVAPAQAVFIDDSPTNVAGAAAVGLTGIEFIDATTLRAALVDLGLLPARREVAEPVYHWALRRDWEDAGASGDYPWSTRGRHHNEAGFVHCSFAHQVDLIRREVYGDLPDSELVLLRLEPDAGLPILVEDGFPHLFAPLPVSAAQVQASAPA